MRCIAGMTHVQMCEKEPIGLGLWRRNERGKEPVCKCDCLCVCV